MLVASIIAEIALAWLNKHPAAIVTVLGTIKINRVAEALNERDILLSKEEWYRLLENARGMKSFNESNKRS